MYICTADMSEAVLHGISPGEADLSGVNFRDADLRFADLSQAVFEDYIVVDGLGYLLQADLRGIVYNNFTSWPTGFTPPPSTAREDFQP